jgi:hypothetical protein
MTTIAYPQSIDQTPNSERAEVRIDPIRHQAVVIDRAELQKQARQIRAKVKKKQKSDLKFWWKTARALFNLQESCYRQFGENVGEREFRSLASVEFSDCDYVVNVVMVIFEWLEKLERSERQLVVKKAGSWTALDTLKRLPKIPIALDKFFWLIELHLLERGKPIPTASAVQSLIDALQGKWQISWSKPLEIFDWAFLAGKTNHFSTDSLQLYFDAFEKARAQAHQIAKEKRREEVYLCDAIAALKSLDYEIVMGDIVEPPSPKEKPLYTEADLEKARIEAVAKYEEDLAIAKAQLAAKNAQLEQLNQQLQSAATSTELLAQKEVEITEQKAQIEWLKKLLDEARQEKTSSSQTISSQRKDLSVVPQTPNLSLKIDDLLVVPPTDPIATIYRDSTPPPPIDLASYQKSAVYQNDWDSKKYQLSLVTNQSEIASGTLRERKAKTARYNNVRQPSTQTVTKGFGRR